MEEVQYRGDSSEERPSRQDHGQDTAGHVEGGGEKPQADGQGPAEIVRTGSSLGARVHHQENAEEKRLPREGAAESKHRGA